MLNQQGFNLWADGYDKTVQLSEENNQYPFAGYKAILGTIFNEIMQKEESSVLDIGFGTGVLTNKLYEEGHQLDGLDFSSKMIEIAQSKMPKANLIQWDLSNGLPDSIRNKKFDAIVTTYALHHFTDEKKVELIKELLTLLTTSGKLYIGDIAFETKEQLEVCRQNSINYWDDDEFYFVHEVFSKIFEAHCKIEFHPISHCGGVFIISK
ncbi:class I SAM-dependent methyltransferase [Viridibacillus sp. YIM B01967]|uniref:Class I SAM-dependent methyltransferase n=1 Tax=Viridibacillus soli TaxID=2798301 RepID=A0ABS1HA80_9BACL|nr:class I SAM-dependent methyltransferase [Viridibacillus soli]MBK3496315.1 class I SAM-dependent methyltransferase [Viridibacillus soli]